MIVMNSLKILIKTREMELMDSDIRQDQKRVEEILSCDFREHCSSGMVYEYSQGDTFGKHGDKHTIEDFRIVELGENVILATYGLKKEDCTGIEKKSLRSSVWVKDSGEWKMKFHQGTNIE